ncbi:MAG TPA: YrdB family protein [Nitrolancea sp.]
MATLRAANLGLRFVLELCMLAALAYGGFRNGNGTLRHVVLGIGAPLLAAIYWGLFLSPKATFRLPLLVRLTFEIVVFGLAIVALYASGQHLLAIIFAIVAIVSRSLLLLWPQ